MVFGFYFNKTYNISRRLSDGLIQNFTTKGISRMEYSVNTQTRDFNVPGCFFILSPDVEIKTMDIISDGKAKIQIGKVTILNDIDGTICGYRCESL